MNRVQAWEQLADPQSSNLSTAGLYDLMLRAGASPEEAQRAANEHGNARLSVGEYL